MLSLSSSAAPSHPHASKVLFVLQDQYWGNVMPWKTWPAALVPPCFKLREVVASASLTELWSGARLTFHFCWLSVSDWWFGRHGTHWSSSNGKGYGEWCETHWVSSSASFMEIDMACISFQAQETPKFTIHNWVLHLAVSSWLSCPRLKTLTTSLAFKGECEVTSSEQRPYEWKGRRFPWHCWKLVNISLFPCKVLCLDLITDRVSICHTGAPIVWWHDSTWLMASKKAAVSGLGTDLALSPCVSFPLN